ncbi:MAG: histidine kinase dimerization/phospho-acceptor domain-containing protein, partial [Myxococcota bacterium]
MDGPAWSLVTGAFFLALAAATAASRRQDGVTVSFAAMALLIAAHETLEFADDLGGGERLDAYELGVAFLSVIPTLFFFVGFVGMRRRFQAVLWGFSIVFATLAVLVAAGTLSPEDPRAWQIFLVAFVPALIFMVGVLVGHARRARGENRIRTMLLLAVLALGAGGVVTNLFHNAGAQVPPLMQPGLLGGATVLALLARRGELISREWLFGLTIGVLSAVVVLAQFLVLAWAGERVGLAAASTVLVVLLAWVTAQPLWATWSEARSRRDYLGTLGRLSAQMAHDLRNPLGAIRMAGEVVLADAQAGRPLERRIEHIELIVEQTRRMEKVIADYQRLGRCVASPRPIEVREIVRRVAEAGAPGPVRLEGPYIEADVDP